MPEFRTRILARTTSPASCSSEEAQEHVAALRSEGSQVVSRTTNTLYQSGFEAGFNWALENVIGSLSRTTTLGVQHLDDLQGVGDSTPLTRVDSVFESAGASVTSVASITGPKQQNRLIKQYRATKKNIMGTIHIVSEAHEISKDWNTRAFHTIHNIEHEYITEIVLLPSQWLIMLGLKLGYILRLISSSTSGWQSSLRALHVVPEDALIFDFYRDGNLGAVRTLCERGLALVNDIDSRGRTPLYVSRSSFYLTEPATWYLWHFDAYQYITSLLPSFMTPIYADFS